MNPFTLSNLMNHKILLILIGLFGAIMVIGAFAFIPTAFKFIYNGLSFTIKNGIIVFKFLFLLAIIGIKTATKAVCYIFAILTYPIGGFGFFSNIEKGSDTALSMFRKGVDTTVDSISKGITSIDPPINDILDKGIQIASNLETKSGIIDAKANAMNSK